MPDDARTLEYRQPPASLPGPFELTPTTRWWTMVAAWLAVFVGAALLLFLQALKHAPYRPPENMSALLSTDGQDVATIIQILIAFGIWLALWWILWSAQKLNSQPDDDSAPPAPPPHP